MERVTVEIFFSLNFYLSLALCKIIIESHYWISIRQDSNRSFVQISVLDLRRIDKKNFSRSKKIDIKYINKNYPEFLFNKHLRGSNRLSTISLSRSYRYFRLRFQIIADRRQPGY